MTAILAAAALAASLAAAEPGPGTQKVRAPHVEVSLVVDSLRVSPGRAFDAGLFFRPERGWHVYWRNPGDTGLPPEIRWEPALEGRAGPIRFPVPSRVEYPGGASYGYEGATLFPIEIIPSATLEPRGSFNVGARARWLVCKDTCVSGEALLSVTRPLSPVSVPDRSMLPRFERARASLPAPAGAWSARFRREDDSIVIEAAPDDPAAGRDVVSAEFFPDAGMDVGTRPPEITISKDGGITLRLARSDDVQSPPGELRGVLAVRREPSGTPAGAEGYELVARPLALLPSLLRMLAFAFLGGLLLNLMPCVLPVISLKVFGILRSTEKERNAARVQALAYVAGVLISFWALSGLILALKGAGAVVGWGFQLQSPAFISILACVFLLLALSLLGVFDIGARWMGLGDHLTSRHGLTGSLASGALAVVAATPCTAPFMGAAIGFALSQDAFSTAAVFTALGTGFAAPYLAIAFHPGWLRVLPRPGRWMDTLKHVLSIPLFGTVAWLLWILSRQAGTEALLPVGVALALAAAAAFLQGHGARRGSTALRHAAVATLLVAAFALSALGARISGRPSDGTPGVAAESSKIPWEPFSDALVKRLRKEGKPVFVNFTADWCLTCQINEKVVFSSDAVADRVRELGFAMVKADWTNLNDEITRALEKLGRSGIPAYAVYPPGSDDDPEMLPELLTPALLLAELKKNKYARKEQ